MSTYPYREPSLAAHSERCGGVDTTFLFQELKRSYEQAEKPVPVDFRRLVSWLKAGDQITHHVHPYPAKLLPHIAHFFLRANISKLGPVVLDPFCGSGTVALEASMLGKTAIIADANPFAILLTKVKTTPYDPEHLREASARILRRASRLRTAPKIHVVNSDKWYAPVVKSRLEILLRAIKEDDDSEKIREFFLICFSATARRLSRTDPSISVPVQLKPRLNINERRNSLIIDRLSYLEDASATREFLKVCHENIERVSSANRMNPSRTAAILVASDARQVDASPHAGMVPLVITSPPYGSAQKYVRATSLSLNWLELARPSQLSDLESKSIGREHFPAYRKEHDVGFLPESYEQFVQRVSSKNSLRGQITRQYLVELRVALQSISAAVCGGGHVVLIIGNNEVCGETLQTNRYIVEVMRELGFGVEMELVDHIKSRGLLTKRSSTASMIANEFIMVFRKP